MRRLHIIDHDGIDYRHHEERYMRDPELREAYECGVKEGWRQAMAETQGYGERNYGHGGGYNQRDMWREQPPMYRERPYEDEDMYEERRRRSSRTGRYI